MMPNRTVPAAGRGLPGQRLASPSKGRAKRLVKANLPVEISEFEALHGAPVHVTPRRLVEGTVQRLIDILDRLDPDPDLEPWLGSGGRLAADVDLEGDDCDLEETADAEPSLSDPIGDGNQTNWGQGARDDCEATLTIEDLPSLSNGKTLSEIKALRALEVEVMMLSARIRRRRPGPKRRPRAADLMLPVRGSCQ